jgi:aryl-alcohol dehydrogenase-like predicted oxidoreductase
MKERSLGSTNLEMTTIGFGAWAIGGGEYAFGWGPRLLRKVGQRHGRSPGEIAVAWTWRPPAVTGAGFRRPQRVAEIAGAGDFELGDADAREIEAAIPAIVGRS